VPDGGLVTDLVEWSVQPGSESIISVSNDAGTRGLVQALAPGEATLLGSLRCDDLDVITGALAQQSHCVGGEPHGLRAQFADVRCAEHFE
jgi:hypothetical protein